MITGDQLVEFKLFKGLSSDKLETVARITTEVKYGTDEIVFSEGDQANYVFGVLEGRVKLTILFQDKILSHDVTSVNTVEQQVKEVRKYIEVDTVGPDDMLGWSGMVKPKICTATATALTPTRLIKISADKLSDLMNDDSEFGCPVALNLSDLVSERLANRTKALIGVWTDYFGD